MNKPNILLITTDQQRFDTIAALGNNEIFTPHLNWLVDEGVAFTRCYSDCPVCMPARATIMTGVAGYNHTLVGNTNDIMPMKDRETLGTILTSHGYQTRGEGKMHFNPMRANYGIEHIDLPMDYFNSMRKLGKSSTRMHGIGENEMEPYINTLDERDTLTYWTVDKSIDFIENRDTTRPFFLWTSFTKPHPPLDPNINYWELYKDVKLSEPVMGDWVSDDTLAFNEPTYTLNNMHRFSMQQKMQIKKAYYACISQIDYNLGMLFARMRELNLLENTWIIFTSDHGELLGDHNLGAKSIFLEGSAHVPFIIKAPAVFGTKNRDFSGFTCDKLITLSDILPTILSICEIDHPKGLDGKNLLEYINNDEEPYFYGNCEHKYFAIIKKSYKYTYAIKGGTELLFDLDSDPYELHNLSKDNDFEAIKIDLKNTMIKEMEKTSPSKVKDGTIIIENLFSDHTDIARFPGLNTTIFPRDSFH